MENEMDEGRKRTLGVIAAIFACRKLIALGRRAFARISRQHRFSGGNDALERFAMALIEAAEAVARSDHDWE